MNKKISLFLLTPVLFSCAGNGGKTPKEDLGPVDVILISGQSNAVGCTQSYYIKISMDLADYYSYYKRNTETFVGQVRKDLKDLGGNKEIPFIDAMISSTGQAQCWSQVNKGKKEFSETSENNFVINTIQEGLHTTNKPPGTADIDHYDSDSMVKLGELFAQKIEPFLEQTE